MISPCDKLRHDLKSDSLDDSFFHPPFRRNFKRKREKKNRQMSGNFSFAGQEEEPSLFPAKIFPPEIKEERQRESNGDFDRILKSEGKK